MSLHKKMGNWQNHRFEVIRHVYSSIPGLHSADDYFVIIDKRTGTHVMVDDKPFKDASESRAISYAEELTEDEEFEKVIFE